MSEGMQGLDSSIPTGKQLLMWEEEGRGGAEKGGGQRDTGGDPFMSIANRLVEKYICLIDIERDGQIEHMQIDRQRPDGLAALHVGFSLFRKFSFDIYPYDRQIDKYIGKQIDNKQMDTD